MAKEFSIIIEEGEDGYLISEVIGLPGCHTQAKTLDELVKRTKDAISLYLKCEKGVKIRDSFVGVQKISIGA
jgi:predicted RNase H-like HicB family nuclease